MVSSLFSFAYLLFFFERETKVSILIFQIVWGWMDAMPALMMNWEVLPTLSKHWGYMNAYIWPLGSITHLIATWLVTLVIKKLIDHIHDRTRSTDYRQTDTTLDTHTHKRTEGRTDRRTDATKCIISLALR